ncbi:MAG TPA: hypothetical protein VD837_07020 [Terriglobales bacterium]|nr:hypothetical protein [Terriglobales bacterium]
MIVLVNNHVLIPHAADWATPPTTARAWETQISEALPGSEIRQALRAQCRRTLSFMFTATTIQERARFDARWDAAAKSGLAAVPFFGRSCTLSADADETDDEIAVAPGGWGWAVGDYIVLMNGDQMVDCHAIASVDGDTLTLETALNYDWPADFIVRPVFFGKPKSEKFPVLTSWHESVAINVSQLVSERSAQLGSVTPPAGSGIGTMIVGSTFQPA